jgi:hypothetical protein
MRKEIKTAIAGLALACATLAAGPAAAHGRDNVSLGIAIGINGGYYAPYAYGYPAPYPAYGYPYAPAYPVIGYGYGYAPPVVVYAPAPRYGYYRPRAYGRGHPYYAPRGGVAVEYHRGGRH